MNTGLKFWGWLPPSPNSGSNDVTVGSLQFVQVYVLSTVYIYAYWYTYVRQTWVLLHIVHNDINKTRLIQQVSGDKNNKNRSRNRSKRRNSGSSSSGN